MKNLTRVDLEFLINRAGLIIDHATLFNGTIESHPYPQGKDAFKKLNEICDEKGWGYRVDVGGSYAPKDCFTITIYKEK